MVVAVVVICVVVVWRSGSGGVVIERVREGGLSSELGGVNWL